jgi:hypothetical protein
MLLFGNLLTSLLKLLSWFFDDSLLGSILILQLLNLHLLGSTSGLEIFKLLCVLLSYSSNLLVMAVLTDFFAYNRESLMSSISDSVVECGTWSGIVGMADHESTEAWVFLV